MGQETTTQIREDLFHLDLPGEWVEVLKDEDDGSWTYRSVAGNEQLTVAIYMGGAGYDKAHLAEMFDDFIDVMRRSEMDAGGPNIELSDTVTKTLPDAVLGRYQGTDSNGRRFANFVVANRAGIASICYEAIDMSEPEFEARHTLLFSKVGFIGGDT